MESLMEMVSKRKMVAGIRMLKIKRKQMEVKVKEDHHHLQKVNLQKDNHKKAGLHHRRKVHHLLLQRAVVSKPKVE